MNTTRSNCILIFNFHISWISIIILSDTPTSTYVYEISGPIANRSTLKGSEGIVRATGSALYPVS